MSLVVNWHLVLADTWQPLTGKTAGKIKFKLSLTIFTPCKLEMPTVVCFNIYKRKMSLLGYHSMSVSMD